jgi:hypothetical protein
MPKAAGAAGDRKSDSEAVYITFQTPPYAGPESPAPVKAFAEKFKAKYKTDPAGYDVYGYDFANIVANAIQKAGSTDKDKTRSATTASTWPQRHDTGSSSPTARGSASRRSPTTRRCCSSPSPASSPTRSMRSSTTAGTGRPPSSR